MKDEQLWYFYPAEATYEKELHSSMTYTGSQNFVSTLTDQRGNTTRYSYNETKGLLKSATDALNRTTNYTYDANTNALLSVSSGGTTNSYSYVNDLLTEINANQFVRYKFLYDEFSRRTGVQVGNGSTYRTLSSYAYNARNLLERQTYGNGSTIDYAYDNLDRMVEKKYDGAVAAVAVVAVVAVVAAVTVATAGAGTAIAAVTVGAAKGAAIGMATGAAIGAGTGAVGHRLSTGSWEGAGQAALDGGASGALSGAITGAVMGGVSGGVSYAKANGVKVQQVGRLKPSNKPGNGNLGVKYQINKANGKPTIKSFEFHANHAHKGYQPHWQQNTWNPYNNSISSSAKHWSLFGRRI